MYTYESAYQATESLLEAQTPPDAIFCANDIMVIGAIDAIRARELVVGQDVSVIGFDNIPMAGWGAYQLTTISQEVDSMIQKTIELMLEKIGQPGKKITHRTYRRGTDYSLIRTQFNLTSLQRYTRQKYCLTLPL